MKKQGTFNKDLLYHFISIAAILLFSILLFLPQLNGDRIVAGDIVSSDAKTKHIKDYLADSGERSYWNAAQFSGGPIYLLNLGQESNLLAYVQKLFTLNNAGPIGMFFGIGLIMYLSLIALRVNKWLSLVISLAYMLSYVFFTLLDAGHFKKVNTLAFLPLIVSGLIVILRNEYLKGGAALVLGVALSIYLGHIQMVYYTLIALVGFGIPLLFFALKEKRINKFLPAIGIAVIAAMLGAASNFAQLNSSQNFSNQTMRGGGVLPKEAVDEQIEKAGLSWAYAMSWSYEAKDFFNIVIPRIVGGGSQENVEKENTIAQLLIQNAKENSKPSPVKKGKVAIPGYWSSMPFTSGGAYIGAAFFFLYILSLILMKKDLALAFGIAFFLIFLLSLGEHAEWFNRPLYDYLPLFDKFRAPSSAVSILPAFIAIAIGIGINKIIQEDAVENLNKKFYIAIGIAVGVLVLILLAGMSTFTFLSANDANYPFEIQSILKEGRLDLFKSDSYRSIGFVLATAFLVGMMIFKKIKHPVVFAAVLFLIFTLDMLPIDRRTVTAENFKNENLYMQQFNPRPADAQISSLEPKGRGYYRVLDLSVNTFNDAKPAYHHNQIGGYDPTKLQRYQDIIDFHIAKNNMDVLNMLNTKYFITKDGKVQTNPNANGNAWFVNKLDFVETDMDEVTALNTIDNKNTAVVLTPEFGNEMKAGNAEGSISLTQYEPNRLVYNTESSSDQFAVFSEIWYGGNPDWKAFIDGAEVDLLRTNYILRAIEVPSGNHEIVMEFKPEANGAIISLISSTLSLIVTIYAALVLLGFMTDPFYYKKELSA